jgi:choline dehydrogenase
MIDPSMGEAAPSSTFDRVPDARARFGSTMQLEPPRDAFDYVIVGGGAAGCALAGQVATRSDASVLLLEAGGADDDPRIHDPQRWVDSLESRACRFYATTPQSHTAGRVHQWPRGRVIGGSSALNVSIFVRGHRADFDAWGYAGCAGWDYASVLPAFKAMEDFEGGANPWRGEGGPLHVSTPQPGLRHPGAEAYAAATDGMGIPTVEDVNGPSLDGTAWADLTIRRGRRQSSAMAFLRPALGRPNLTVFMDAPATGLVIERGRCHGVRYRHAGRDHVVRAGSEVILCTGSLESPRLLMLSGIGPADHLASLGIPVVADLQGVGRNLQDHLLVGGLVYEAKGPMPPSNYNHSEVYTWCRSDPALLTPDLFLHHHSRVFAVPPLAPVDNGYTLIPGLARAHSRGWITLASADPDDAPVIEPHYLSEPQDRKALLAAIKITRDIGESSAFAGIRRTEILPGPSVRSDAALAEFMAQAVHTFFHPTSTCRMGHDADAVVDPRLRVYGIEGLRVADASVMPSNTSANTQAPSMMIGWKGAAMVLDDARKVTGGPV